MAFQKYTMRSVRDTYSKSRRLPLLKSHNSTLRPLAESRAWHLGQVQNAGRPPSLGAMLTPSRFGFLFNSSIFSLAMAAIRSGLDTHNLARSGFLDWSREPSA